MKVSANPAPNAYSLPTMTGGNIVERKTAASFSMTGRSLIGSFHQDLKNVSGFTDVVIVVELCVLLFQYVMHAC